ncbi:MAG: sporulation protein YunB [Bacillota bacterium]
MGARFGRRRRFSIRLSPRMKVFVLLVVLGLVLFQTLYLIEHNLSPTLRTIAEARVQQIATQAINDALSKKIANSTHFRRLVEIEKDRDGRIQAVLFNYTEYVRIQAEAARRVLDSLRRLEKELENEERVEAIPLGRALNSEILTHFGPDIRIKLIPIGAAKADMGVEMQQAGINIVLVRVYLDVQATVRIVIPFATAPTTVSTRVPITQAVLVGQVPDVYYQGFTGEQGNMVPPPAIITPQRREE